MDKVVISGIEAYGYHGVFAEEKKQGQLFVVDLEVYLDLAKAGESDLLTDTLDYTDLSRTVQKIIKTETFNLIEALADKIAKAVLNFKLVEQVKVTLAKPFIPSPDFSGKVKVEIFRNKAVLGG